jgi:hypothetical protein
MDSVADMERLLRIASVDRLLRDGFRDDRAAGTVTEREHRRNRRVPVPEWQPSWWA